VPVAPTDSATGYLNRVFEDYAGPPRRDSFFGKLQFHFSVGQAF
jgi:hypothetical protein